MSKIKVITNLDEKTIFVQKVYFGSGKNELEFYFRKMSTASNYNDVRNLKFSYELQASGKIQKQESYPPDELEYQYVDDNPLVCTEIEIKPDIVHTLIVKIESDSFQDTYQEELRGPIPEKPYPSWIWNGETYQAPVEMLNVPCTWNESLANWEPIMLPEYIAGPRD
jgi:hypothetical protein